MVVFRQPWPSCNRRLGEFEPSWIAPLLLLMLEHATRGTGAARVDGVLTHVDMLDDTLLVDDKRGAIGKLLLLVQNAILFGDGSLEIAEEGEHEAFLLGKGGVGGSTIDADSQHLGAILLELGDISLIRLELLGSAAREGQNVES
jgi:hypothetical protein